MSWYRIENPDSIASPSLLVYPERIRFNIEEMVRVAGDPARLRPHVKTHKCREIVSMQQAAGITKFKCATIAEAEMLAECQANDVLLAYQPTGPTAQRLLEIVKNYPDTVFSALVDDLSTARRIDNLAGEVGQSLGIFIDLDVGMHRTGIIPGPEVHQLRKFLKNSKNLKFRGWHIYDGHIRNSDFEERKRAVEKAFEQAGGLTDDPSIDEIVAGGSPTFPVHALNPPFILSPGTCLLWDQGYGETLPEQKFLKAAVLLTRVISKPDKNLLCLDLGHKAVASEMPHPRVSFPELKQVEFVSHSEEHLVIRSPEAADFQLGDVLYGIPMHICPTVALHQELVVIEKGKERQRWEVYARNRRIRF